MPDKPSTGSNLKRLKLLLWLLVALAAAGSAALLLVKRVTVTPPNAAAPADATFGGPFTLVGADAKPFSSAALIGKPYALYFGFTRCGDVCPTTLFRMVNLRKELGGPGTFNIVFVTIDPLHDGPKEVGQYATLFNSPIIGLTGSPTQIDRVKKQFGIFAQASPHPTAGKEMMHSAFVLLFDRRGRFVTTIAPDDPDSVALKKLKTMFD